MKKKSKKTKNDLPSVYIAVLSLAVIVLVFGLAYASKMNRLTNPDTSLVSDRQEENGTTQVFEMTGEDAGIASGQSGQTQAGEVASVFAANGRVKFKIDHFKKLALQPLEFDVFDANGKAYSPDDLQTLQGNKMQLIIVSANLREFQHLYPAYDKGKWKALANIPSPGTYHAYVDVAPNNGKRVVLLSNLVSQNETVSPAKYPEVTKDFSTLLNKGLKAQLKLDPLLVLQKTVFSYTILKNGKPVELKPYLGSFGSLIIFRHSDVNSMTRGTFMSGSPDSQKNGVVEFSTTFLKGGTYTAFSEVKVGGIVFIFPVTFDVKG